MLVRQQPKTYQRLSGDSLLIRIVPPELAQNPLLVASCVTRSTVLTGDIAVAYKARRDRARASVHSQSDQVAPTGAPCSASDSKTGLDPCDQRNAAREDAAGEAPGSVCFVNST
jgi:hypothetical protein